MLGLRNRIVNSSEQCKHFLFCTKSVIKVVVMQVSPGICCSQYPIEIHVFPYSMSLENNVWDPRRRCRYCYRDVFPPADSWATALVLWRIDSRIPWDFTACALSPFSRPFVLQNPAAGSSVAIPAPPLRAAFSRGLHEPHALRRQHPARKARGQLPRRQRGSIGVWASRRGLGGLRGHILGSRLQDATVTWCLHQSLRFYFLDTQSNWTRWQKEVINGAIDISVRRIDFQDAT